MKHFFYLACLVLFTQAAISQSSSIKGSVKDTLEKKTLKDAVITLLNDKDSVLVKYTRADAQGNFDIGKLDPGNYVMLITYPKYADYADKITVPATQDLDVGTIPLTLKSLLLNEVVVRANMAMRIKGDTTEFTADSFKVRDGATVEELLREFPGMQVNSRGEITMQGKRVDKVLVDGEEFFGADPTIATQNILAKQVDKVQVYDTKTEQDQIKGIGASGDANKTVDIKLKASAKKGYFGNLMASSDFQNLHNGKVMLNKFTGNKKVSVYGTRSKINTGALGYNEQTQLGVERDLEYDEIGGYYYSYGDASSDFDDYSLRGLPDAYSGGALYGNKWNEDKQKINLYYLFNRLGTTNRTSTISQTLLGNNTKLINSSSSRSSGLSQRHVINAKYEWKIDSFATIKYTGAGTYSTKDSYAENSSQSLDKDSAFVNTNQRTNESSTTKRQLDNVLTYTQLFRKKDRRLVTTLRLGLISDEQQGKVISNTIFYDNNQTDSVDQLKLNTGSSTSTGIRITYNEPLSKKWNLVSEYSFNGNSSVSHRNSYNKDNNDKHTVIDSLFSNNFELGAFSNSGTLTARFIGKKLRSAFGAGLSAIQLNLNNLDSARKTKYNFTGFTPQTQLSYMFKPQTSLSFTYRGSTVQPTLNQLQPLRNNENPLNIYVGNPDLKVGFRHTLGLTFYNSKVLKGTYYYLSFNMNFLPNAITNRNDLDTSLGKNVYMPVNVKGNKSWSLYGYWSSGQGDKKLLHGIDFSANGGRNLNYFNFGNESKENINTYTTVSLYYSLRYNIANKLNFSLSPNIARNISKSSLSPATNNNYWSYGGRLYGYVKFKGDIELSTDINANIQQKTSAFPNPTNIIVWNAELRKKFLKKKTFELAVVAYDMLNQNIGFSRTINSNFINEERFDRISRYFLLRATWTFNKMTGN